MISLIEEKLGNCKKHFLCNCSHKSSIYLSNSKLIYIYDNNENDENCDYPIDIFINEDCDRFDLKIINGNEKNIAIIKYDHCFYNGNRKSCECILFVDNESIYIIEIKDVKTGQKGIKRKECIEKFKQTLDYFNENGIDLSANSFEKFAIICFTKPKGKNLKNTEIPSIVENSIKANFQINYKFKVREWNEIDTELSEYTIP